MLKRFITVLSLILLGATCHGQAMEKLAERRSELGVELQKLEARQAELVENAIASEVTEPAIKAELDSIIEQIDLLGAQCARLDRILKPQSIATTKPAHNTPVVNPLGSATQKPAADKTVATQPGKYRTQTPEDVLYGRANRLLQRAREAQAAAQTQSVAKKEGN